MNKLLVTLAVGSLSVLTSANAADVLFVTGSPDLEKSNASRVITQLVQEKVPGVEIVRTDKIKLNSPEDIERERNRVSNAKIIVFHYPVYWYQPPAVFKNYLDSVYTFGFAHNANGGLLTDKKLILSVTSGAPEVEWNMTWLIFNFLSDNSLIFAASNLKEWYIRAAITSHEKNKIKTSRKPLPLNMLKL